MEVYDEFLNKLLKALYGDSKTSQPDEMVPFLRDFMRKLILWSGPEPIAAFLKWKEHLSRGRPDAQTIFLTEDFLMALRKDLRHTNRGIPRGFFAHFYLKQGALLLSEAQKNPNITLAEFAALEVQPEKMTAGIADGS